MKPARTRFAPSPTGFLHVGGVRTALFAWLLARQTKGQFILRFEDTDKNREVEGAREHLINSLHALGLQYDEGPDVGGSFGPYVQSERLDRYKEWAQKLIDKGRAYADPTSPEEIQKYREEDQAKKRPFLYRNHRPDLTKVPKWDGTQPLRFKSDPGFYAHWSNQDQGSVADEVMGELTIDPDVVDDFILIKSDGYPTYNFAHIIDDYEMEITHVIRGQEFLSSMPNFLALYDALGFSLPKFAHVPHILGPDGKKKLSKRDGAKDVLDYIRDGYLPEALISFIATLGWNDGTEQEIFTVDELIRTFSLDRVQKGGARFDEQRLLWMNGHFIREKLSLDELYRRSADYWPEESRSYDDAYKRQVLSLVQERLKFFAEIPRLTDFFFTDLPVNPALWTEHKQLKKLKAGEIKQLLHTARAALESGDFTVDDLSAKLNSLLAQTGQKPAVLFSIIRIATTQAPASPGLAGTLAVLGKERSLARIDAMLHSL